MWPDNETERDFLNFSGVADTVAEIIVQARGGTARDNRRDPIQIVEIGNVTLNCSDVLPDQTLRGVQLRLAATDDVDKCVVRRAASRALSDIA